MAIIQAYKYLEDNAVEMMFALNLYRPQKPYMEVRYPVNDSYMTVLGNPQYPVYDLIVLQVSGNSTPIRFPHVKEVKMTDNADSFAPSSRSIWFDSLKRT